MMTLKPGLLAFGAAASLLVLSGCGLVTSPNRQGVTPALQASCRRSAEDTYVAQNRSEIYRADNDASGSRSPFSTSSYAAADTTRLSTQYGYQRNLDDCYNIGASPAPDAPVAPKH